MIDRDWQEEARCIYEAARCPGTNTLSDVADVRVSPCGARAVFTGTVAETMEGLLGTGIFEIHLTSGQVTQVSSHAGNHRHARYAPGGAYIAWLRDTDRTGDFQLMLRNRKDGSETALPALPGWAEYFDWSPDGERLLIGVAGHGADVAGASGAVTSAHRNADQPAWAPQISRGDEAFLWRSLWIYDLVSGSLAPAHAPGINFWEAGWCGNGHVVGIASNGPGEGQWYHADLRLIDLLSGQISGLHRPVDQIGLVSASADGRLIAFVEAVCSDRGVVAGNLVLLDRSTGECRSVSTAGIDVTCVAWLADDGLLLAGHRGFETVVAQIDLATGRCSECWVSDAVSITGRYASASPRGPSGDCVIVTEGFLQAPQIELITAAGRRTLLALDTVYADRMVALAQVERHRWRAMDGLAIDGWLLLPQRAQAPYPLVMSLHGGPVWLSRPIWLGRNGAAFMMLLEAGVSIFLPNPRGSAGRGRDFARRVIGDMGGLDARDCLSGIDHLIDLGIADPDRLGVTGMSYGGYLTAWLITQDPRFAAAAPVAPMTNLVTQYYLSNIPHFVEAFVKAGIANDVSAYLKRSPLMHAHKARTPTLSICGALDRCTPPEEARQFHRALLDHGVRSSLVVYPGEGHGVRRYPAVADYAARLAGWFAGYLLEPRPDEALS